MSFLNKVKNFFYEDIEEDEEDIRLEEKRKEERRKQFLEKERKLDIQNTNNDLSERELFKSEKTFNFPMDIGDNIFDDEKDEPKEESRSSIKEEKNIYARPLNRTNSRVTERMTSYKSTVEKKEEPKKFRPSPVVSPIYGVLDKNYSVDDVVDNSLSKTKEFSYEKKIVDFDSVRNKAYKELDEEIERTMNGSKNIFYNLDEDEVKEENTNTISDYINEPYDKNENKEDDVIITYNDSEEDEEEFTTPDVSISNPKEEKKEEKEDLFNLIDNMYSDDDDDDEEDEE
ncbi:MAG: hypothetical protein IIZ40_02995 [Bacilli bacterium]|nr:hypothetical protein [Bacilli bacterium]